MRFLLFILFPVFVSAQNITINGAGASITINGAGAAGAGITDLPVSGPNKPSNTTMDGKQVFVIIGNSIAVGRSETWGPRPYFYTVFEWNGSAVVPVVNLDLADANDGSPWPQMGIDYNTTMSKKPVFVSTAVSGAYFSETTGDGGNNWSTTGARYSAMITKVNSGLAAVGVDEPRGIFIELGINDSRSSVALSQVETDVISLFSRLQTDFPDVPVYVTEIGRHQTAISDARIDAIRGYLENEIGGNVKMAYDLRIFANDFPEYYSGDLIHLNQTGNNAWGAILATYLISN